MNAVTKKTISYFEGMLGISFAVLCATTLRFALWAPELLQKNFSHHLRIRGYIL